MTEEQLAKIKHKTAEEVIVSVPGGAFYSRRVTAAVEAAMSEEWWRGYHAGRKAERADDSDVFNAFTQHTL